MSRLAAVIRGENVAWEEVAQGFFEECERHSVLPLVQRVASADPAGFAWPDEVVARLRSEAARAAAEELLHRRELVAALEALARAGIQPLLMKGTALAYSVYAAPSLRPRCDTDCFVCKEEVPAVRAVMAAQGFEAPNYSAGELLFCQFMEQKLDDFGASHVFDFHWEFSCRKLFSQILSYDELLAECEPCPPLGPHARAIGRVHALLVACVHPVMHHAGDDQLIWAYDVHVLVSSMSGAELARFCELCAAKGVREICRRALVRATELFSAPVPAWLLAALEGGASEATASFLAGPRRWHEEQLSDLRALSGWGARARLLREIALPSPEYMLRAYPFGEGRAARLLLPALYLHRGLRGVAKVLRGAK